MFFHDFADGGFPFAKDKPHVDDAALCAAFHRCVDVGSVWPVMRPFVPLSSKRSARCRVPRQYRRVQALRFDKLGSAAVFTDLGRSGLSRRGFPALE